MGFLEKFFKKFHSHQKIAENAWNPKLPPPPPQIMSHHFIKHVHLPSYIPCHSKRFYHPSIVFIAIADGPMRYWALRNFAQRPAEVNVTSSTYCVVCRKQRGIRLLYCTCHFLFLNKHVNSINQGRIPAAGQRFTSHSPYLIIAGNQSNHAWSTTYSRVLSLLNPRDPYTLLSAHLCDLGSTFSHIRTTHKSYC